MAQSAKSSRLQVSLAALAAATALGASLLATAPAVPSSTVLAAAQADNTLTAQEKAAGWRLLFDGATTKGWRNAHHDKFPDKGWIVKDGILSVVESGGAESAHGGDIVTTDEYGDFELKADVKLTKGANSGIKYFVTEKLGTPGRGSAIGLEYQLLDDAVHPDAKAGREGNRTFGSLYDLIAAPKSKPVKAIGEWNTAHIVSKGTKVEHWLNGTKLIEFDRASESFKKLVAISKYKDYEGFGQARSGHLLLQDHGNTVYFRNIKVKGTALPNT
jgi:hypothetical protein